MEDFKKQYFKKRKYSAKCAQALPILSGTMAAILTEGKTINEIETLGVFLSALANDVFFIASVKSKNADLFIEDITII